MKPELSRKSRSVRLGRPLDAWRASRAGTDVPESSRASIKHQVVIALVGVVIFFTNLGSASLFDMDEALYATCAREMSQRGDWVVPWFNGQMFPDKPPLMFWLMMASREVLGPTELAVRLQAALFAIATALATYHLGRLLFRREVGFWAGLIVSTSIIFTVSARAATVDSALTFAITAAMLAFVAFTPAWRAKENPKIHDDDLSFYLPQRWLAFVLIYALVAVAVLAKGPVGLIMPVGALGLFLLMVDRVDIRPVTWLPAWLQPVWYFSYRLMPRRLIRAGWQLRPLTALAVVGLIAAPWYVLVGIRTDGEWLRGFLAMNVGPAVKAILNHHGPWFYHLAVVFIGFFPWSVFIGPMLVGAVRRVRADHPWRAGYVLVMCWMVAIIGLWSAVAMKLPHHILPAYPALALLAAPFVYAWMTEPAAIGRWWMRNASITFIVVGLGICVALPLVAAIILPGEQWIGWAGLPLVVGGASCWWFSERRQTGRTMAAFTVSAVVFLTFGFGFAVLGVDRHQNGPPLAAALQKAEPGNFQLATFRFFRESFVYYTGKRIERISEETDLDAFLAENDRPFVITTNEHEKRICDRYPGLVRVVHRRQQFLELDKKRQPELPASRCTNKEPVDRESGQPLLSKFFDTGELVVLEWLPNAAVSVKPQNEYW